MFLGEVALGRERHINRIDCSLTRPPDGYDSVVARGHTEPGEVFIMRTILYSRGKY